MISQWSAHLKTDSDHKKMVSFDKWLLTYMNRQIIYMYSYLIKKFAYGLDIYIILPYYYSYYVMNLIHPVFVGFNNTILHPLESQSSQNQCKKKLLKRTNEQPWLFFIFFQRHTKKCRQSAFNSNNLSSSNASSCL